MTSANKLELRGLLFFFGVFLTLQTSGFAQATSTPSISADASLTRLEQQISRLAKLSGGTVGVAALNIESGERFSLNGSDRFPMTSVYKVPIAVQLLSRVDKGEVKLGSLIEVKQSDLHPGTGTLARLFSKPGVVLSIRNLLELMLVISDNTAADILLKTAGGPKAVTSRMREIGIEGIDVSRPLIYMFADLDGIKLPPENEWTPATYDQVADAAPAETKKAAAAKFVLDPRDTSTPDAMVSLLGKIYRKEVLSSESSDLLLDIMKRCQTGPLRLKGMLPAGTVVAHKTGSLDSAALNDVGVITLPDNAGHVAIAVFIKSSDEKTPEKEHAIAEIARTIYDYFLFKLPVSSGTSNR